MMNSWTPERVSILKDHYAAGMSCARIAALLGGTSRNAVIGKVHRLQLELRGPDKAAKIAKRVATFKENKARAKANANFMTMFGASRAIRNVRSLKMEKLRSIETAPSLGLAIVDLNNNQCRYATNAEGEPYAFCGHDAIGSWCPAHQALVFKPAETRTSKRAA